MNLLERLELELEKQGITIKSDGDYLETIEKTDIFEDFEAQLLSEGIYVDVTAYQNKLKVLELKKEYFEVLNNFENLHGSVINATAPLMEECGVKREEAHMLISKYIVDKDEVLKWFNI